MRSKRSASSSASGASGPRPALQPAGRPRPRNPCEDNGFENEACPPAVWRDDDEARPPPAWRDNDSPKTVSFASAKLISLPPASRGWQELNDLWDPQYIIDRAIHDLTLAERIVPAPSGHCPVLLDPGVFGAFLSPVTDGINGRTVATGGSPLADKIGQTILDPVITITDNPHRDFSGSAASLDGDGMPTARHTVVDKGVLKMFLYDLDTAAMVGVKPTGNGGCRPRGIEILPGEKTHEELMASIDEGIYVKGMLGFGQGNIASGDFSANISPGYLVRKGEIVGRIKDTMIAGNLLELMKQNVQLSSDYDEPGRTPWAIVDGVSVSSSAG